jgi:hypothetical protein
MIILIEEIFNKYFRGRNVIIKNQDIRYLLKSTIFTYGPFFYLNLLLKYTAAKENSGARTNHQYKQVFDLLNYVIDFISSKENNLNNTINKNKVKDLKHNNNKNGVTSIKHQEDDFEEKYLLEFDSYQQIFATITSRIKDFSAINEEVLKIKENKTILSGLFNFFSKIVLFIKRNKRILESIKAETKILKKSITFIIVSFKGIFEKIPDLKSYLDKVLEIEEQSNEIV